MAVVSRLVKCEHVGFTTSEEEEEKQAFYFMPYLLPSLLVAKIREVMSQFSHCVQESSTFKFQTSTKHAHFGILVWFLIKALLFLLIFAVIDVIY